MGLIDRIKNMFRKGGAAMGVIQSLGSITDHPKINIDPEEYRRIETDRRYFSGKFKDVFYRNTYGDQKSRPFVTLNMMKLVAQRFASLLYNEKSTITVETRPPKTDDNGDKQSYDEPDKANVFVQGVLDANDFDKNFERYLESGMAMGGLAIRPYVDMSTGKVKLSWVQAPNFFPLKSNTNDITSAAIATPSQRTESGKVVYYTLLEFHEWTPDDYVITNELYRSEVKGAVGVKWSLNSLYEGLEPETHIKGLSRPLFVYLKPAGFNNKNLVSPLGIGVCDNALSTLSQINDTYDQLNWEVKMGQRRVAVPDSMIRVNYNEATGKTEKVFDEDQNVYVSTGSMDDPKVTDLTTEIRGQEYITVLNQLFKTLEMQVGLSVGTFSFDGQSVKTATEVVSENSMTYQTRNSHLTMVERAVQELVVTICELAKATDFNGSKIYTGTIPTIDQVSVDFDDGIFTDKGANADYWIKLEAAKMCPKWQAVMHILGVTETEAKRLVAEINDETIDETPPLTNPKFDPTNDDDSSEDGD